VDITDEDAHSDHVQLIRCDIKLESVDKCRDVENGEFSRKAMGNALQPQFLKHRDIFLKMKMAFSGHS
jgi:hypothetical protein